MPMFDTYRKQAKLLVRWHRQRNHSVAGRIRNLARYAHSFYGAVSRDGARLHLKWVREPAFGSGRIEAEGLIMAFVQVANVKALYAEFIEAGVGFRQKLTKQAWGGNDFHVRDPDGNVIAFVG